MMKHTSWIKQFKRALLMGTALAMGLMSPANAAIDNVQEVQTWLTQLGFEPGPADGSYGKRTKQALEAYYQSKGGSFDGDLSDNEVQDLKAVVSALKLVEIETEIGDYGNKRTVPQIVETEIGNRQTINPFLAWNAAKKYDNRYGLHWTISPYKFLPDTITVAEVYWNYVYDFSKYPGEDEFITKKNWDHDAEYGHTLVTEIDNPNFINFISNIAAQSIKNGDLDGVFLDWWHNYHPSGYSEKQVAVARRNLIDAIRSRVGKNFIIVANVNWSQEEATVEDINGVFLELYKDDSGRVYNTTELLEIETLLEYYDKKLAEPRIVALEGWRKTNDKHYKTAERNSPENRRMAKILTAMSVVVPENGYILYGDNNQDQISGDHDHVYYDFYSFDIGRPTSSFIKIKSGMGYKEHEGGFIAYNITEKNQSFTRSNGETVKIEAKSGLFCKNEGASLDCLPYD